MFSTQINPEQAASLNSDHPYNPAASGARSLSRIPAPTNPNAMPQTNAQRKAFLLEMLPTYHNHEKTFDKGTNRHGRTHAARSFVFSIAMGNIRKEKGVTVDLNAVALATAGHDTGRLSNAGDDNGSEARSGDNVNAAVERRYPGAAGYAWKTQVKANITAKTADQTTIEGYLFKSAASLDYSRLGNFDEEKFPFLQEPIVTEDGLVVAMNNGQRRQLMKEALLLAQRTDPRSSRGEEMKRLSRNVTDLEQNGAPANEIAAARNLRDELNAELDAKEREQTENLSDQDIVDLVENVIRSSPKDFPLLTKYYLNAE